ncbi:hypothetical protein AVEN_147342-1, partial [Araneus ventricosus]
HIAWRKGMQIDAILTDYEPSEVLNKYVPTTFLCFDKDGSVVRINDAGRTDLNGLWNVAKKTELAKYVAFIMEQDKERVIKQGRNVLHLYIYFHNLPRRLRYSENILNRLYFYKNLVLFL